MPFISSNDVHRLLNSLTLQEKEAFLAEQIADLPAESKARLLGLADSNLTVLKGTFVSLNPNVAVNIQDGSDFDPETVLLAVADFMESEREKK
ncbi:hypothetical protein [Iningainema tapete]|nr:hypothetical protein [Iningainema tapete]